MRIREVIEYIAFDGKVFTNAFECQRYEETHEFREIAEQKLRDVAAKINDILKDNDMDIEVSSDYDNEILICFNEHFEDLGVPL